MNEVYADVTRGHARQARKIQTDNPQTEGNRTVTYDADGKKWTVTFHSDKATDIKQS